MRWIECEWGSESHTMCVFSLYFKWAIFVSSVCLVPVFIRTELRYITQLTVCVSVCWLFHKLFPLSFLFPLYTLTRVQIHKFFRFFYLFLVLVEYLSVNCCNTIAVNVIEHSSYRRGGERENPVVALRRTLDWHFTFRRYSSFFSGIHWNNRFDLEARCTQQLIWVSEYMNACVFHMRLVSLPHSSRKLIISHSSLGLMLICCCCAILYLFLCSIFASRSFFSHSHFCANANHSLPASPITINACIFPFHCICLFMAHPIHFDR